MRTLVFAAVLGLSSLAAQAEQKIGVALDWTPNTNHVGLYVAQAKGWFEDAGLSVDIQPYTDTPPTVLVDNQIARFGVVSGSGYYVQRAKGADAQMVMAIVQKSTGRIVFNADREDIQRPADLDGKIYAGFGSDYEAALLGKIIRNDGGEGIIDTVTLGTSAYEALDNRTVDFTQEIKTWEGINAVLNGHEQRGFEYSDYGVPDTYTTYLIGNETWMQENPEAAGNFVKAVQRGFAYALENPEAAAQILIDQSNGMLQNNALVFGSMKALAEEGYLKDEGEQVGEMDAKTIDDYVDFLFEAKIFRDSAGEIITERPDTTGWFTNEFLAL